MPRKSLPDNLSQSTDPLETKINAILGHYFRGVFFYTAQKSAQ